MAARNESGEYWIISVPNEGKDAQNVIRNQSKVCGKYCSVHPVNLPPLRISAVDELMKLNETLCKYDVFAGSVVQKIVRSFRDFGDNPEAIPTVADRSIYNHIPEFSWDKGRNPYTSKLSQISGEIHSKFVMANDRLKTLVEKYKQVRQKLTNDERAEDGNLMVCDLQKYIKQADYVTGEYITTALVVVPQAKGAEFEATYWSLDKTEEAENLWKREEKMKIQMLAKEELMVQQQKEREAEEQGDGAPKKVMEKKSKALAMKALVMPQEDREKLEVVCPNSAELLKEEGEFLLYRVVVMKRGLKWFKQICREFRYSVRDFVYKSEDEVEQTGNERKNLKKEESDKKRRLVMFCQHSFSDVVDDWLHLKMIRVFVEAVLRYGPPAEDLVTSILTVNPGRGGILNKHLTEMYKHLTSSEMLGDDEDDEAMALMGNFELRPYVFIPVIAQFD